MIYARYVQSELKVADMMTEVQWYARRNAGLTALHAGKHELEQLLQFGTNDGSSL